MKIKTKVLITIFSILIPLVTLLVIIIFVPARPEYYNLYFETSKMSDHNKKVIIQGKPRAIDYIDYNTEIEQKIPYEYNLIFPREISTGNLEFFSFYEDGLIIDGPFKRREVFLSWTMDAATFDNELSRLKSIYLKKPICFSKDLFASDSYIATYNYSSEFEYAIIDYDKSTIYYIWLREVGSLEQMVFDDAFKPSKLLKDSDLNSISKNGEFTIH